MKIGFFVDNIQLPSADFTNPENGSPGVGASLYIQAAVPYFMRKYVPNYGQTIIYAPYIDKMPEGIKAVQANTLIEAAQKAKEENVDFFVFRARTKDEDGIIEFIDSIKLPSIGVGQLTPFPNTTRKMANSKYFKALVCVGREQYDSLLDTPLYRKLAYIDNGVHLSSCWENADKSIAKKNPRQVVYMGALVPVKGFHILAEAWPKVLEKFPDAKLSVIGSVKVYGENLSVGTLGVAEKSYEEKHIIPYLCDEKGNLHPSVTFHGQMGQEKFDVIHRSGVGVANPTGKSETCCVSAVEISACKVPVVSGAYYALLDTVLHKETGLLGRSVQELADNICKCFENPDYARQLGQTGYIRVKNQYDFEALIPRWCELFESLSRGSRPKPFGELRNIQYHYKALRLINSLFQRSFGSIIPWPSLFEVQILIEKNILSFKNNIKKHKKEEHDYR